MRVVRCSLIQGTNAAAPDSSLDITKRALLDKHVSASSTGKAYFCDPRGHIVKQASRDRDEVLTADLDLDTIGGPKEMAILPRPPAGYVRVARESVTP